MITSPRPFLGAVVLGFLLSASVPARGAALYERLGGKPAITAVVDEFITRAAADKRINKKAAKTDIPRWKFRLAQQLCFVTGGPCPDVPRSMETVHGNMGITNGEFDAVVEDLVAVLNTFKVPAKEQQELLAILGPLREKIVQVQSKETGTNLPASFNPAGPLSAGERKKVEAYERGHAEKSKSGKSH